MLGETHSKSPLTPPNFSWYSGSTNCAMSCNTTLVSLVAAYDPWAAHFDWSTWQRQTTTHTSAQTGAHWPIQMSAACLIVLSHHFRDCPPAAPSLQLHASRLECKSGAQATADAAGEIHNAWHWLCCSADSAGVHVPALWCCWTCTRRGLEGPWCHIWTKPFRHHRYR